MILFVVLSIALIGNSYGFLLTRGGFRPSSEFHKAPLPELWHEQTLDHFTPTDPRTFQQRYVVNETFFNRSMGENIFLLVGGEGYLEQFFQANGLLNTLAEQFQGLAIILEHRYYGKSSPQSIEEPVPLKYLSSEQAIVDTAFFIEAMNTKFNLTNPKWILNGGSYSGSLVAWIRYKFPHVVTGAISVSAPILAKVDFFEFYQAVEQSMRSYCNETVDVIGEAFETMSTLGLTEDGCEYLRQIFNTCSSPDVEHFYKFQRTITFMFPGIVQNNVDYKPNVTERPMTINDICRKMGNETLQPLERLANLYNEYTRKQNCAQVPSNDTTMESWMWQSCTEFGYIQTTSENSIFGNFNPLETRADYCGSIATITDLYRHVDRTNLIYGGLHPDMTNVLSIQGTIDPWHPLGLLTDINEKSSTIVIEGASHVQIMLPKDDRIIEPKGLQPAREEVSKTVAKWLSE